MSGAIFKSAHQALAFAYSFARTQYGDAAVAERAIEAFAHKRYPDPPRPPSRGLVGLDGAAQAAFIKRIVERQPVHERFLIEARFAQLESARRVRALRFLALRYRRAVVCNLPLRVVALLVQHYFGAPLRFVPLAEAIDMRRAELVQLWGAMRRAMLVEDRAAMDRIELALERAGIVERVAGDGMADGSGGAAA